MKLWKSIRLVSLISMPLIGEEITQKEKHSELYIGPQGYYANLKIEGISSKFHGGLFGGVLGYQYIKPKALYFRIQADWAAGRLSTNQNNPSRYLHDENVESNFGFTWQVNKWQIIPYTGYAFHYLIESRKETEEFAAVKFKYQTYNIPLGMRIDYLFNNHYQLGLKAAWAFNIDPAVKISGLSGALWQLAHKQGVRVDLPFQYNFGKKTKGALSLIPFFAWYELGHSLAVSDDGVPLGITNQFFTYWGGLATIAWKF